MPFTSFYSVSLRLCCIYMSRSVGVICLGPSQSSRLFLRVLAHSWHSGGFSRAPTGAAIERQDGQLVAGQGLRQIRTISSSARLAPRLITPPSLPSDLCGELVKTQPWRPPVATRITPMLVHDRTTARHLQATQVRCARRGPTLDIDICAYHYVSWAWLRNHERSVESLTNHSDRRRLPEPPPRPLRNSRYGKRSTCSLRDIHRLGLRMA